MKLEHHESDVTRFLGNRRARGTYLIPTGTGFEVFVRQVELFNAKGAVVEDTISMVITPETRYQRDIPELIVIIDDRVDL